MSVTRTFDRTRDIPKLVGCIARNVEFRWSLFERHLSAVPPGAAVLDFGAGSLRESHELCARGFDVTAIDRDEATLKSYRADYEWPRAPQILAGTDLSPVAGRKFALITAFDVFEHLEDPQRLLGQMRGALADEGLVFCSVPNRRTLFEIGFRLHWKIGTAMGRRFPAGEPHLQFKSPREWREFFERCGYRVVAHDMAIGFFVNTWAAIVTLPAGLLRRAGRKLGLASASPAGAALTSPRVMAFLDAIDRRTRFLRGLYGWNLFVLARDERDPRAASAIEAASR